MIYNHIVTLTMHLTLGGIVLIISVLQVTLEKTIG